MDKTLSMITKSKAVGTKRVATELTPDEVIVGLDPTDA